MKFRIKVISPLGQFVSDPQDMDDSELGELFASLKEAVENLHFPIDGNVHLFKREVLLNSIIVIQEEK